MTNFKNNLLYIVYVTIPNFFDKSWKLPLLGITLGIIVGSYYSVFNPNVLLDLAETLNLTSVGTIPEEYGSFEAGLMAGGYRGSDLAKFSSGTLAFFILLGLSIGLGIEIFIKLFKKMQQK